MTTLLAVSPHLDDAVFSIGALLARWAKAGERVVVATCFTASVPEPQGFALACQLDKGLGPEVDYMALRRAEDAAACALLGAEVMHLTLAEAPHRGYDSAPALFGGRHLDDAAVGELVPVLADLIAALAPGAVLGPLALGGHVDHHVVRDALAVVAPNARLWADLPYAAKPEVTLPALERVPCGDEWAAKLAACRAYDSQFGFQFGSLDRLAALASLDGDEGLTPR